MYMYVYVYFNKCMQTNILKHCIEIMLSCVLELVLRDALIHKGQVDYLLPLIPAILRENVLHVHIFIRGTEDLPHSLQQQKAKSVKRSALL